MEKLKVLNKVTECGVVAVVRADSKEEAILISDACVKGGILAIEITFTIRDAESVIKELADHFANHSEVVIGAGTVLDDTTARMAILAGAKFIVSPCFDKQTAKLCHLYQIPYMPGCMTITEMKHALEHGVDIIKLFPGDTLGPGFVKAVKAPLPQVNVMPTGGVNLDNVEQWIKNGCVAVGVGGNLIAPAKTGEYEKITENARQYVQRVNTAREGLQ
ncbi:bifunctional 4-hydroxy-2-oxoglutarate aldolase/2-dehydro-3-deoxy-phosphogluconate aldolase [Neobacillus kokaensis]|uniref:2-dehydro-3-deoxy-phosphogluconate aldolase n=1 Tax=Neobacillus kokaensis TaxID=2759023 RepID=A0ABQ3MYU8_9BACI|nr:bifunctional 4-hydroxy-2-oxoglutarate aldolase/2-dehydro-3-deoxy-phosphogluconate aldolase [Neobacillus kokaensis]GHH97853.1 2-dehydro-3-deoxy-phosphogluconate aldolase [Neobacillus kokaensis]